MKSLTSIVRTSVILSGLGLVGSLFSFAAQLALARTFGAGVEIDAYFVGNSFPTLVGGLLVGALTYQIVPMLIHCDPAAGSREDFQDALLQLCLIAGALLMLAGSILSWVILSHYPNSEIYMKHHVQSVAVIGWLAVWNSLLIASMTAICHVQGRFFRVAGIGYFPSLFTILTCGIITIHGGSTVMVAVAVLAGQIIGTLYLLYRLRHDIAPLRKLGPALKRVCNCMGSLPLVLASMLVFTSFGAADAFWASRLGNGTVATLAYSQRMIVALAGLAVNGVGVVMLPRFAQAAADDDRQKLLSDAVLAMRAILILILPVAVAVALLALPTITMLYTGGRFDGAAASSLATLMPYMFAGMVPMSCCTILFRAHYALRDTWGAAAIGTLGALTYFGLSGVLLKMGAGLIGFGGAYMCCWGFVIVASALRLWGSVGVLALVRRGSRWVGRVILASGLFAAAVWSCRPFIPWESSQSFTFRLGLTVAIYAFLGLIFVVLALALRIREIQMLVHAAYAGAARKLVNPFGPPGDRGK